MKAIEDMEEIINDNFYSKLSTDRIKINWNKNPIKMDLFFSFLKIDVEKVIKHLGASTGWTKYENIEHKLIIDGGVVGGVNYLNAIQFGSKLANIYNNYITPFHLFEHFTNEGKKFFVDYYKEDIDKILESKKIEIQNLKERITEKKDIYSIIQKEVENLTTNK